MHTKEEQMEHVGGEIVGARTAKGKGSVATGTVVRSRLER